MLIHQDVCILSPIKEEFLNIIDKFNAKHSLMKS
jgi:hypothetical protein